MKIEKWKYNNEEIDVKVLEESEIETNENPDDLENTKELTEELKNIGDDNE